MLWGLGFLVDTVWAGFGVLGTLNEQWQYEGETRSRLHKSVLHAYAWGSKQKSTCSRAWWNPNPRKRTTARLGRGGPKLGKTLPSNHDRFTRGQLAAPQCRPWLRVYKNGMLPKTNLKPEALNSKSGILNAKPYSANPRSPKRLRPLLSWILLSSGNMPEVSQTSGLEVSVLGLPHSVENASLYALKRLARRGRSCKWIGRTNSTYMPGCVSIHGLSLRH